MATISADTNDIERGVIQVVTPAQFIGPSPLDITVQHILEALPQPIYMTDAAGRITFYNDAAVELWGVRPELGATEYCGSWKLYSSNGQPLAFDQCSLAIALREQVSNRGMEAVAERPDGSRVSFVAFPTPLFDVDSKLTGAVSMLVDITERALVDEVAQRFSAIVESSQDAILAKNLDGVIDSWNRGAERLFGYSAAEAIGQQAAMLIPLDRRNEEPDILKRIHLGEQVEHFETIRRRKDGSLVEISLSVSPIRNREGKIVGASKIARDITLRRRAEEQQHLLIREMDHRVKNLFTLATSVVSLSARSANTTAELASAIRDRLTALAKAHALTVPSTGEAQGWTDRTTTLHTLLGVILAPYVNPSEKSPVRAIITGVDTEIAGAAVTSFALLLHEFATNAAKYGSLSVDEGVLHIGCEVESGRVIVSWTERGGPTVVNPVERSGFGTVLGKATVQNQLGGEIARNWDPEGLSIRLTVLQDRLLGNWRPSTGVWVTLDDGHHHQT